MEVNAIELEATSRQVYRLLEKISIKEASLLLQCIKKILDLDCERTNKDVVDVT